MDGRDELAANLEGANHGQVEVLVAHGGVETSYQFRFHAHHAAVSGTDGTGRLAVLVEHVIVVLYLDHAHVATRLQNVEIGNGIAVGIGSYLIDVRLIPQAVVLVVVDDVDGVAHEPAVGLVPRRYYVAVGIVLHIVLQCQLGQLVAVGVEVHASFPVPAVLVVDDDTVQGQLPALVLGLADVAGIAVHTRGGGQRDVEQDVAGLLCIVFERTREATVEEREVETEVPSLGVLPAQLRVRQCVDIVASLVVGAVAEVVVAHVQAAER